MHFVQRRRVKIRIIRKQLPQRRRLGRRGGLISAGIFVIAEIQFLELIALIKGLGPSIDDRRLQPDRAERITVSEGILAEGKRPLFPLDLHRFQSGTFGKSSGSIEFSVEERTSFRLSQPSNAYAPTDVTFCRFA